MWGGVTVVSRKTKAQRQAAAEEAGVDPVVDLRAPGLLELPQRILDDVAAAIPALLAGPPPVRAHRHRHRHGRDSFPPGVPGVPGAPGGPVAHAARAAVGAPIAGHVPGQRVDRRVGRPPGPAAP